MWRLVSATLVCMQHSEVQIQTLCVSLTFWTPLQALEGKKITPPHVPKVKNQLDDSNFDEYPEDEGLANYPNTNFPKKMFEEFANVWVGK